VLARVRLGVERIVLAVVGTGALVATMPALSGDDEKMFATQTVLYLGYCVLLLGDVIVSGKRVGAQ